MFDGVAGDFSCLQVSPGLLLPAGLLALQKRTLPASCRLLHLGDPEEVVSGDLRSYALIQPKIRTEYDIWRDARSSATSGDNTER